MVLPVMVVRTAGASRRGPDAAIVDLSWQRARAKKNSASPLPRGAPRRNPVLECGRAMLYKLVLTVAVLAVLSLILFPKRIPRLLRGLGRGVGRSGRLGRELATGVEEPGSPLARLETRAGELLLARTFSTHPPCDDADLQAVVASIGERLAAGATRREIAYRFVAVESDEPNAFAVPGGAVLVTRSLLALAGSSFDQIAGVIAHEIQHIDRRHALEQLGASALARFGARFLPFGGGLLLGPALRSAERLLVEGYRRDQEFDADLAGAELARRAGFDPRGLAQLLTRLERQAPDGSGPLWTLFGFFSSHPPARERIARLEARFGPLAKRP